MEKREEKKKMNRKMSTPSSHPHRCSKLSVHLAVHVYTQVKHAYKHSDTDSPPLGTGQMLSLPPATCTPASPWHPFSLIFIFRILLILLKHASVLLAFMFFI